VETQSKSIGYRRLSEPCRLAAVRLELSFVVIVYSLMSHLALLCSRSNHSVRGSDAMEWENAGSAVFSEASTHLTSSYRDRLMYADTYS
jgi:hypothetical protein